MLGINKKSDATEGDKSPSTGGNPATQGLGTQFVRGRPGPGPDAHELFKRFSQGQKIFKFIMAEHFDQLRLELDDAVMLAAKEGKDQPVNR